jgi:hypothetical protein
MEYLQQHRPEEVVCKRREGPLHVNAEEFATAAATAAKPWQQPWCTQPAPNHLFRGKSSETNDGGAMDATHMELTVPLIEGKLILLTQAGAAVAELQDQANHSRSLGSSSNECLLRKDFMSTNMDTARVEEDINKDIEERQCDSEMAAQLPVATNHSADCPKDTNTFQQVNRICTVAEPACAKEANSELPENGMPTIVAAIVAPPADGNAVMETTDKETNDETLFVRFVHGTTPTACVEEASNRTPQGHGEATIATPLNKPANKSLAKDTIENKQRCGGRAGTVADAEAANEELPECTTREIEAEMMSRTADCNVVTKKPSDSATLDQHANHDLLREGLMLCVATEANHERHEGQGDAAALLETKDATALKRAEGVLPGSCLIVITTPTHAEESTDDDLQNAAMPSIESERMVLTLDRNVETPVTNDSPEEAPLQIPPGPTAETEGPAIVAHASSDGSFCDFYKEGPSAFGKEAEEQMLQTQPLRGGPLVGPDQAPDNGQGPRHDVRPDPSQQYAKEKKRPSPSVTFLGAAISKKYRSHSLGSGQAPIALVEGVESVLTNNETTMTTGMPLELPDSPHSVEYIRGLSVAVECCLDQVLNGIADRATMWQNAQVNGFVHCAR